MPKKKYNWFSPSNANIWTQCPGAVKISQPYLKLYDSSESAKEGIAAHWVVEQVHAGVVLEAGSVAKNGVSVTQEMIDGAVAYLDIIGSDAIVEQKINLDNISPGMFGYIDAFKIVGTDLFIYDYKFGHTPVEAFENDQMLASIRGILDLPISAPVRNIHMEIVQPRVYQEVDNKWSITLEEYLDYLPAIVEAARDVLGKDPEINTGPHCKRCKGRQACVALRESTLSIVDLSKGPSTLDLPASELGQELSVLMDAQDRIKARVTGLEEQAKLELSKGENIKGFTLQPSVGNLSWKVPVSKIIALGDALGKDLRKPEAPMTPTQAIKAGLEKKTVDGLAERPSKGAKLKRVDFNKMRKVFKK